MHLFPFFDDKLLIKNAANLRTIFDIFAKFLKKALLGATQADIPTVIAIIAREKTSLPRQALSGGVIATAG